MLLIVSESALRKFVLPSVISVYEVMIGEYQFEIMQHVTFRRSSNSTENNITDEIFALLSPVLSVFGL